jgi:hypothetical protein
LLDPTETLLQRQVQHQLMEVYNYQHCYAHETDPRIRLIWDEFLHMELEHLQLWGRMLAKYEGIEPEALFGDQLTVEFRFEENKDYIRKVLKQQMDLRQLDGQWVPKEDLPGDWPSSRYKQIVNADGIPSEEVVDLQASRQDPPERPGDELLARARDVALRIRA